MNYLPVIMLNMSLNLKDFLCANNISQPDKI